MWNEGTIGVPTGDGKYLTIHYWVKRYEEPSEEYGIEGGRISKLSLSMMALGSPTTIEAGIWSLQRKLQKQPLQS